MARLVTKLNLLVSPCSGEINSGYALATRPGLDASCAVFERVGTLHAEGTRMQLEHLCDVELAYRREPLYEDLLKMVVPYDTLEGSLYGEACGSSRGSASVGRLAG